MAATLGVRASAPLGISASATAIIEMQEHKHGNYCDGDARGLLLQVEAGSGGGQFAVGIGSSCVDDREHGGLGPFPWAAAGVKAVVTRTWGNPWLATPDSTYGGLQADVTLVAVNARLGFGHRLTAGPSSRRWIFVFGLGLGF